MSAIEYLNIYLPARLLKFTNEFNFIMNSKWIVLIIFKVRSTKNKLLVLITLITIRELYETWQR